MKKYRIYLISLYIFLHLPTVKADVALQAPTDNATFNAAPINSMTPYNPNNAQIQSDQMINNNPPQVIADQAHLQPMRIIGIGTGAVGYFWDADMTDITLTHPGKARIQDDEFINCIAVDATNTNFDPGYLNLIGTGIRVDPLTNNPIFYNIYGAYLDTITPTPDTYETI